MQPNDNNKAPKNAPTGTGATTCDATLLARLAPLCRRRHDVVGLVHLAKVDLLVTVPRPVLLGLCASVRGTTKGCAVAVAVAVAVRGARLDRVHEARVHVRARQVEGLHACVVAEQDLHEQGTVVLGVGEEGAGEAACDGGDGLPQTKNTTQNTTEQKGRRGNSHDDGGTQHTEQRQHRNTQNSKQ